MVLCSLPILGPCAQRQRYATVCCADRPTFLDYLSINPLLLLLQGQAESGGMVLVAYAGPVRPAAALRNSVLCLPTDTHFVPDAEGLLLQEGSSAGTDSHKFSF